MKIIYYKGVHPNFGDYLNPWMWPKIIPGFFDDDDSTAFLGIGSIIGLNAYKSTARKIVFGASFVPEYHEKPDVKGPDWHVYFVRGPRSAEMLGLSPDLALGDPAILLRTLIKPQPPSSGVVSFMPHWASMERGKWEDVCRLAGINLIDARLPVETIIGELQRSRVVIAEAMHGAIVADALRIPWIPVMPLNPVHRCKWFDWAESLQIKLHRHRLCPSSLMEARLSILRRPITESPFAGLLEKGLLHAAAHRLERLAHVSPTLSDDSVISDRTERMLAKVAQMRADYAKR